METRFKGPEDEDPNPKKIEEQREQLIDRNLIFQT